MKKASKLAELYKDFGYEAYWKEKHELDFRDEDLLAVIDLMKSARKSPYFNAGMDRAYRL